MAAFRFASMLLLLVATIVLATDVSRYHSGAASALWIPASKHWAELLPNSFASTRKSVQAVNPALWEWGVLVPLRLPAWVLLGGVGGLLGYVGRHRRRINIFTN